MLCLAHTAPHRRFTFGFSENPDDLLFTEFALFHGSAAFLFRSRTLPLSRPSFRGQVTDLSNEFKITIYFGSKLANQVFEWFEKMTQAGSHAIGTLFTGVYFFDACFWPVSIPVGYGMMKMNALDALETMPKILKEQLQNDVDELWSYALYFVDCFDFTLGSEDIHGDVNILALGKTFLENGEREIRGIVSQLLSARPNSKAILNARMAVEIYLKSLLIIKSGKSEQDLKNEFGHNLTKAINACYTLTSAKEFDVLCPMLNIFPDVAARYTGSEEPIWKVWEAYSIAQAIAAMVVRILSGRDTRPQLKV